MIKIKYILKGENNYFNPLTQVLKNRKIDNIDLFLKPNKSSEIHFSKLKNISKAVRCFLKHARKGGRVAIQVDSDPD